MSLHGFAYFVKRPRTADDLLRPHLIEQEQEYEVVKTITLSAMDYENFITDMLADRAFLEENAGLCSKSAPFFCLLITRRGGENGVLVVPNGAYVESAAATVKSTGITHQR